MADVKGWQNFFTQHINSDKKCMDPFVAVILQEALDYCIEKADKQIENANKIFPSVNLESRETLDLIRTLKNSLDMVNPCGSHELAPVLPGWVKPKSPKRAQTPPKPVVTPEVSNTEDIESPHEWIAKVSYQGKDYTNPTELSKTLGFKTRGTTAYKKPAGAPMIKAFNNVGLKVYADDEHKIERTVDNPGPKDSGKFIVVGKPVIPENLRIYPQKPTSPIPVKPEVKKWLPKGGLYTVKDAQGNLKSINDENGPWYPPSLDPQIISQIPFPGTLNKGIAIAFWANYINSQPSISSEEAPPVVSSGAVEPVNHEEDNESKISKEGKWGKLFKIRQYEVEPTDAILQVLSKDTGTWSDLVTLRTQEEANEAERQLRVGSPLGFKPEQLRIAVSPQGLPPTQTVYITQEKVARPRPGSAKAEVKEPKLPAEVVTYKVKLLFPGETEPEEVIFTNNPRKISIQNRIYSTEAEMFKQILEKGANNSIVIPDKNKKITVLIREVKKE